MSPKPVLYYAPRSPPCRAVLLTAAALGIDLDLRLMNLSAGDHLTAEFLKLNPQHTIPVLDDDGVVIADSHVICSYLADKYSPLDSLYPRQPARRMQVDARLYYDCGHLFPRCRLMVEPVLYFGATVIGAEKIAYMQRAYDGLERCLAQSTYLCGDDLTIADLCCVATVSTTMMFAPIESDKFPKMSAWLKRLSQLPYYEKNNGEGAELLAKAVKEKLLENEKKAAVA